MARAARLVVPDCPHHIIHRGHNREPVFLGEGDYRHYLRNLFELKRMFRCRVYAYCLMPNHVHLLLDPGPDPKNLSLLMKHLAGRQARYCNRVQGSSGAVWEGRFRSSPVAPEYVPPCCWYIELNPVRAYLVDRPEDYGWSSYRSRLGMDAHPLDGHPNYTGQFGRHAPHRQDGASLLSHSELAFLRDAIQRNQVTGDEYFRREIEYRLGQKLNTRQRGRPRKEVARETID